MVQNQVLIVCVAVAVILQVSFASECSERCQNFSWRCHDGTWNVDTCNADNEDLKGFVHHMCPEMCGLCTPCPRVEGGWSEWKTIISCHDKCNVGDIEVQARNCNNPAPQNGGALCEGDQLIMNHCQGCSDVVEDLENINNELIELGKDAGVQLETSNEFDSDGYRLFLRHTEQDIGTDEFFKFCKMPFDHISYKGIKSYENKLSSLQYRDPDFAFFFPFTTEVKVKIFDSSGDEFGDFVLKFGKLGEDHPATFGDMIQKKYMSGSSVWTDFKHDYIGNESPMLIRDNGSGRHFLFPKNLDRCHTDEVWFLVEDSHMQICDWDRMYGPYDNTKSFMLYSTGTTAQYAQVGLARAQKVELWYKPTHIDPKNGFERVFKYASGAGVHILDYFRDGTTDSSHDSSPMTGEFLERNAYRDADIQSKIEGASYVMLVVYAYDGSVVDSLVYSGTGDMESWMTHSNLKWNYFWEFDQTQDEYYGVKGHSALGRNFFINRNYGGECAEDAGWLVVLCSHHAHKCSWQDFTSQKGKSNEDAANRICQVMYSPSKCAHTWQSENVRSRGAAIEIYTMA